MIDQAAERPEFQPNYQRMYQASIVSLSEIDKALGISDETHIVGGSAAALSEIGKLRGEVGEAKEEHGHAVKKLDALQALLTGADELLDSTKAELAWQKLDNTELRERLRELISAVRSINRRPSDEVLVDGDDQPQYRQRKEWIEWVLELCESASSTCLPEEPITCSWSQDTSGVWSSYCGVTWAFMDGSPNTHGMHFCHSCGKKLVVGTDQSHLAPNTSGVNLNMQVNQGE
ncbi:hypothetical protein [Pseudomonas grimontii]|uniref:hypothetical protein n=1 Tax=Pseudomonas grimontii TaxID=129847 RepID=UPI00387B2388